jgi:hypothetical protein
MHKNFYLDDSAPCEFARWSLNFWFRALFYYCVFLFLDCVFLLLLLVLHGEGLGEKLCLYLLFLLLSREKGTNILIITMIYDIFLIDFSIN